MQHIPTIQYELISSWNYPVDKDSLCYQYCVWLIFKDHVNITKLPLPCAFQIVLQIVTKWNRCKGCIGKMTHFLDGMNFLFSKGSPKQVLVICKLKKKIIAATFAMKHCFQTKPIPTGKGFSAIQTCYWYYAVKLRDFLSNLATNYQPYNASHRSNHYYLHKNFQGQKLKTQSVLHPLVKSNRNNVRLKGILRSICQQEIDSNNFATNHTLQLYVRITNWTTEHAK